jgi:hypothetical protein
MTKKAVLWAYDDVAIAKKNTTITLVPRGEGLVKERGDIPFLRDG